MARTSLIPEVLTAVVVGLRATAGLRAPTSTADGATVYDGPEFLSYNGPDPLGMIVIGYGDEDLEARQNDQDGAAPAMTGISQVRAISTASPKDQPEDDVQCVAWFASGDVNTAAVRASAFALVDLVDTWCRANGRATVPTQSDGSQVMWVQVHGDRSLEQYLNGGSRAKVRFTLRVKTRT
jgi:hypothetical protein